MFGSKTKKIRNHDRYNDMWNNLTEISFALQDAALYVRKVMNAIELYPEGPDKEAEKRELVQAKERLIYAIADYDGRRAELTNFYLSHLSELEGTRQIDWRPSQWPTSHQIVRNAG